MNLDQETDFKTVEITQQGSNIPIFISSLFSKAVSIMFCYFYQLTFFGGFLVVHSLRIKAKRNSIIWCIKHETVSQHQQKFELETLDHGREDETQEDSRPRFEQAFWEKLESTVVRAYKFLLTRNVGKSLVVCLFVVYMALSVYYGLQIREGMDVADLVAHKSHYRAYMHDNVRSVSMSPVVMLVIYEPVEYTDRKIRAKINSLIKNAQKISGIKKDFKINWLDRFEEKLVQYKQSNYSDSSLDDIQDDLAPMSTDIFVRYNQGLQRSEIYASRFYVQYEAITFSSLDAKPMHDLVELCARSGLPILPYSVAFKAFEQFEEALPNVVQSFVVAAESMYFISLLFVPDVVTALCIVASMGSIMIGMIACMHLWGLTLSSITMIQLVSSSKFVVSLKTSFHSGFQTKVMSIGFCVDFSAHLTHAFLASVGPGSRSQRSFKACMHTGLPIFNSAISTIFGVLVLAFCESYIFISFFKTLFIVMCLGVLNSMLFLPLLLGFVGPHWLRHKNPGNLRAGTQVGGRE